MADLLILTNPLDASRRRRLSIAAGLPLLAWLEEHAPTPVAGLERSVLVNGAACTDRGYRTGAADEILLTFTPGAAAGPYIAQAIISIIVGLLVQKLFPVSQPKAADVPDPSQVYGIGNARNQARLGGPIPVIYGSVIATPDYAAQPYTYFEGNEQFLHAIFCLGMGDHTVTEMLIGDSSAAALPLSTAQWWSYLPAQHQSKFGVIQTATSVRENVVTCSNVGDQELIAPNAGTGTAVYSLWYWKATNGRTSATVQGIDLTGATTIEGRFALMPQNPNIGVLQTATARKYSGGGNQYDVYDFVASDYQPNIAVPPGSMVMPPSYGTGSRQWIGPFETCKPGQRGHRIEIDIVFPSGLYGFFSPEFGGQMTGVGAHGIVEVTPINDAGNVTGGAVFYGMDFWPIVNPPNTPQRYTLTFNVASGRYRVRVARDNDANTGAQGIVDRHVWAGLKFALDDLPPTQVVYGNVTLIAVKLKATNGIASSATGSIRFRCQRRLAPLGLGTVAGTNNPADAFVDVVCAPYGGNRPRSADELDLDDLTASRAAWASHNGFNAVFDQASTVWEALGLVVQTVHAAPLPVGSRLSLIHDQVQPVRSQLFTDANIAAGTLQVTYAFDKAGVPVGGVQVNWRDPRTFSPAVLLSPPTGSDYQVVNLFGCTDQAVAQEHANLITAKRMKQRRAITFECELEGLNVLPGDRIGVQAGMVQWAQGARVVSVAGLTLTLDTNLVWTAGSKSVLLRDPQGVPVRLNGVNRGAADNVIVLPSAPGFTIIGANDTLEATSLSFGTQNVDEVTDWTVAKITPHGDTVTIDASNYDASIYSGAADFTRAGFETEEA